MAVVAVVAVAMALALVMVIVAVVIAGCVLGGRHRAQTEPMAPESAKGVRPKPPHLA